MKCNGGVFKANSVSNTHELNKTSPFYQRIVSIIMDKYKNQVLKSYNKQKR